jgi:hypothetical protein
VRRQAILDELVVDEAHGSRQAIRFPLVCLEPFEALPLQAARLRVWRPDGALRAVGQAKCYPCPDFAQLGGFFSPL